MKRYVIERHIPGVGSLARSAQSAGRNLQRRGRQASAPRTVDSLARRRRQHFCVYLADSEDRVREHSRLAGFPITRVNEIVTIIDPMTAESDLPAEGRPPPTDWRSAVSQLAFAQPNSPYVDFWNTVLVPKFDQWRHILVGGLGLHSTKVFPQLKLASGDAVLDVGCGWGETAIEIARRVGPSGRVVGLDCCDTFLAAGRADAAKAGVRNVSFVAADVETFALAPEFDVCFSRFGTQFFQNPVAGLRNMRRGLKPGGIMTMIVWRARADNPWLERAKKVLLRYLPPVAGERRVLRARAVLHGRSRRCHQAVGDRGLFRSRVQADRRRRDGRPQCRGSRLPSSSPSGRPAKSTAPPSAEAERKRDTLVRALEHELQRIRPPGRRDDGVELVAGDRAKQILRSDGIRAPPPAIAPRRAGGSNWPAIRSASCRWPS